MELFNEEEKKFILSHKDVFESERLEDVVEALQDCDEVFSRRKMLLGWGEVHKFSLELRLNKDYSGNTIASLLLRTPDDWVHIFKDYHIKTNNLWIQISLALAEQCGIKGPSQIPNLYKTLKVMDFRT